MKLPRNPTAALVVTALAVLGVYAFRQEIELSGTSLTMSYRVLALATLAVVAIYGGGVSLLRMRDRARRGDASDFSRPLALLQQDDIGELAREINRKLAEESEARLAALEQLRHTDRLATVGHLAAGIAHELGTPLSVTSTRAELIAKNEVAGAELVHSANVIVEQADRMADIIRQLLDFSRRRGGGNRMDADLREVATSTLDLVSGMATKAGIEIVYDGGAAPVPVFIDKNQMQQALMNIVLNGIQAMPNGGRLRVQVDSRRVQPPPNVSDTGGEYQCICVEDDGLGIAPNHLPQLFEPFFTTKRVGEGTGLGLPVAHGIVAEHGGWIAVDSVEGRGSRFSILLPRAVVAVRRREAAA